jgi:hypothetical protein
MASSVSIYSRSISTKTEVKVSLSVVQDTKLSRRLNAIKSSWANPSPVGQNSTFWRLYLTPSPGNDIQDYRVFGPCPLSRHSEEWNSSQTESASVHMWKSRWLPFVHMTEIYAVSETSCTLEYLTMGKVQEVNNLECCAPSLKPFIVNWLLVVYINHQYEKETHSWWRCLSLSSGNDVLGKQC